MSRYDLCLAWNWEHDADFAGLLERACQTRGLSFLQITPEGLPEMMPSLVNREMTVNTFFDRASDADPRFAAVVQWACHHVLRHINPHDLACRAWDKVAMHQAIGASMDTPLTLILPSYDEQPVLPEMDLTRLGSSFAIKPARGGGGDGVIMEATALNQVLAARRAFPSHRYLLQTHIVPTRLGPRPAWFRVLYCAGKAYLCWWDNCTHIYAPVTPEEEDGYQLGPLRSFICSIATLCGLDLFSTEMTLTSDGRFVIVDYVNDPIDLRLQSKAPDGVPDEIVRDIAGRLVDFSAGHLHPLKTQELVDPYFRHSELY
jgi:hypothetical protein